MTISSIFQTNDANVSQTTVPNTSSNSFVDTTQLRTDYPIPGLAISTAYSGFRILLTVSVDVDSAADVSETFDLLGTSDGSNWTMSQNSVQSTGGNTNVSFTIDSSGQIKYTSTATPVIVKRTLQWLKQVL